MDCNLAQLAMMEHMEKTIHPSQAQKLAKHVMKCESCREYYIGFDMAIDVLSEPELIAAPDNFTEAVMSKVCALPAYTPQPEPTVSISLTLRILWGFSAIFLGIGLLFAFNPEWLQVNATLTVVADSIVGAVSRLGQFVGGMFEGMAPTYNGALSSISMFNVALIFVVVIVLLLFVLQRTEKSTR